MTDEQAFVDKWIADGAALSSRKPEEMLADLNTLLAAKQEFWESAAEREREGWQQADTELKAAEAERDAALERIRRLEGALHLFRKLVGNIQFVLTRHLEPSGQHEDPKEIISDVLALLDGPAFREAEASAEVALADTLDTSTKRGTIDASGAHGEAVDTAPYPPPSPPAILIDLSEAKLDPQLVEIADHQGTSRHDCMQIGWMQCFMATERAWAKLVDAAKTAAPPPQLLKAAKAIMRFGELASVQIGTTYPGGKKPASKEVWQFPRHMLTEIEDAIKAAEEAGSGADGDGLLFDAAKDLATAEAAYRSEHDAHGAGDIRTARAWDHMRKAGNQVRQQITRLERYAGIGRADPQSEGEG